jgi:hypothetical protein
VAGLRIPSRIKIASQTWTVEALPQWSDSGTVGDCDARRRRIRIVNDLAPEVAADTLIHELIHAMLYACGGCHGVDADTEERIAYALAPMMVDLFASNPSLLALLRRR